MILELLSINISNPQNSYLTILIKTDQGNIVNLLSYTLSKNYFSLSRLTSSLNENIPILNLQIVENQTGKVNLFFDPTSINPNISLGDILSVFGGSEVSETLGEVLGTSTMNTGVGTVTTSGDILYIKTPTPHRSVSTNYNLNISYATQNGVNITGTLINLPLPIILNGITIKSIRISPLNGTSFNGGDIVEFKIVYYDDIDGQGTPVEFHGSASDILVATLVPQ